MIPSAEGFAAMVVALGESLDAAEGALVHNEDVMVGLMCIRSARATATALSHMASDLMGPAEDEVESGPATDDPATCGHPLTFDQLPNGQIMCESCGASHFGDEKWALL